MRKLHIAAGRTIVLGLLMLIASVCHGQTTATIVGTVKDATGAVLPDTAVSVTSLSTGIVSKGVTNSAGFYRFAGLDLGMYTVEVTKDGFRSILKNNIELHVEDIDEVNFAMEVGAISESVTVEDGAVLVDTQTATLGDTISGREVQEAPLNGRNVMNLMELVPGIVPGSLSTGDPASNQGSNNTAQQGFGNYQVGGGASGSNQTYVDGVSVNTSGTSVGIIPSTDSVSEFRVDFNSVSPQFGAFGGGVISFSTKSGTNKFHGTAFEYARNTIFDANTFFNDRLGQAVPILQQNQFGATLGGPIVRKKTFFFVSWAQTRLLTAATQDFWAPTAAEMAGDFTADYGTVTDGIGDYTTAIGQTQTLPGKSSKPESCPGGGINKICPQHLSPTVQQMFKLQYYRPTAPVGSAQLALLQAQHYNQAVVSDQPNNEIQYVGRVDHQLTAKQSLFARYTYWNTFIPNCDICKMPALPTQPTSFTAQQYVGGDHYTLNSTTAIDFRLGYTRWYRLQQNNGNGHFNMAQFDSPQSNGAWAAVASQLQFMAPPQVTGNGNVGPWTNAPFSINLYTLGRNNTYNALLSVTKVYGHHTFVLGGEARRVESTAYAPTAPGGGFSVVEGATDFPASVNGIQLGQMAEFIEGVNDNGGSLQYVVPTEAFSYYQGYYVSDTWQVMPKLTVNLGLRWELPGASADKHNPGYTTVMLANAPYTIPGFSNPAAAYGGTNTLKGVLTEVQDPAGLYPSRYTSQIYYHLFDPRLGVAYSLDSHTAIRAGFGISHPGGGAAVAGGPLVTATTSNVPGFSSFDNPYPASAGPILKPLLRSTHLMDPYSSFPQTLLGTSSTTGGPQAQTAAYVMQWNLNVERSFGKTLSTQVAYTANKAIHNGGARSLGQLNMAQYIDCATDTSLASPCGGNLLTKQIANPLFGIASPSGNAGKATTNYGQFLLPYPDFTAFPSGPNHGQSNYNALLVSVKKRMPAGGVATVSYTWAHLLSLGAIQDNYNPRADYGNDASDIPQYLTASYVTDLPVGQGRYFLSNAHGLLNGIVSGWGLQGITQYEAGFPLSITVNGGTTLSKSGFGVGTIRPNVVPGVSKRGTGTRFQRITGTGTWFNPLAFANPGPWSFGNESAVDSTLRSDSMKNWDMALVKATKFKEGISLQFRAEYFNVFNHPQYGAPVLTQGASNFGMIPANTANGQTTQAQPRIGQLALRLNF